MSSDLSVEKYGSSEYPSLVMVKRKVSADAVPLASDIALGEDTVVVVVPPPVLADLPPSVLPAPPEEAPTAEAICKKNWPLAMRLAKSPYCVETTNSSIVASKTTPTVRKKRRLDSLIWSSRSSSLSRSRLRYSASLRYSDSTSEPPAVVPPAPRNRAVASVAAMVASQRGRGPWGQRAP